MFTMESLKNMISVIFKTPAILVFKEIYSVIELHILLQQHVFAINAVQFCYPIFPLPISSITSKTRIVYPGVDEL